MSRLLIVSLPKIKCKIMSFMKLENCRSLKIVFQYRALLEIRIDGFIRGANFQVARVAHEQVHKTAFAADLGLNRNFFFNAVILANHHDEFQVSAGS